ncbi:hypothetical protein GNF86_01240 [Clostridium perfringens]
MISTTDICILIAIILSISIYGFLVSRRLYKKRGFGYKIYYIASILLILTSIYPLLTYNNPNRLTFFLGLASCTISLGMLLIRIGDLYLNEIHY